jgi:hypothetical protein
MSENQPGQQACPAFHNGDAALAGNFDPCPHVIPDREIFRTEREFRFPGLLLLSMFSTIQPAVSMLCRY